jgi:hypothetical protein
MRLTPMEVVPVAAAMAGSNTAAAELATGRIQANTAVVSRSAAPPPLPKRTTPPAIGIPDDDGGLGALYELSEQADSAAVAPEGPHCPSCMSRMDDKAVLCTNCGYDTRSGKALATVKEAPVLGYATPRKKGQGKPVDMMAPQGSFAIGVLLASVFGVVCGILWIVVMFVTGFEIGILATVVGWTVGLGMQIGQKGYSRRGGITAATIAVLAILGPKLLLLSLLLAVTHGKNAAEFGLIFLHPLTILFVILGIGAAYRTANGSSN